MNNPLLAFFSGPLALQLSERMQMLHSMIKREYAY